MYARSHALIIERSDATWSLEEQLQSFFAPECHSRKKMLMLPRFFPLLLLETEILLAKNH